MNSSPRFLLRPVVGAVLAASLVGCAPQDAASTVPARTQTSPAPTRNAVSPTAPATATSKTTANSPAAASTAAQTLKSLGVKGKAPKTGYSRDEFGPRWADVDHNGCDTRNDILRRDLTAVTADPKTHGCKILTGTLVSPYTGATVDFVAGESSSSEIQIDHVVALSDAWQKGAQQWDADQRRALANDPLNLRATDGPSNSAKGDADAATWLPQATDFRCEYVATQIAVKQRYNLWVTEPEKQSMDRVLERCPDQQLPATTPSAQTAAPTPISTPPDQAAPYYARCRDAREAGVAPLHEGEPGYRPELDGDGNGVACGSAG